MKKLLIVGLLFALFVSRSGLCLADLVFTLTPTNASGAPGDIIHFFGSVLNTGPDVNLASLSSTYVPALDASEDFTPFFTNFAGTLASGGFIDNLAIYDLTINNTAAPGEYSGSLTINDELGNPITGGTALFTVSVTPEPAEFLLYGAGLAGLVVWKRKRRKDSIAFEGAV